MKMLRDPLFWLIALFVMLIFWLPYRCLVPCFHNCRGPFISRKVLLS